MHRFGAVDQRSATTVGVLSPKPWFLDKLRLPELENGSPPALNPAGSREGLAKSIAGQKMVQKQIRRRSLRDVDT